MKISGCFLLAALSSTSAFTVPSLTTPANGLQLQAKAATSKEEDLELTRQVIKNFMNGDSQESTEKKEKEPEKSEAAKKKEE